MGGTEESREDFHLIEQKMGLRFQPQRANGLGWAVQQDWWQLVRGSPDWSVLGRNVPGADWKQDWEASRVIGARVRQGRVEEEDRDQQDYQSQTLQLPRPVQREEDQYR
jgi:hypothetical protein